MEDLSLHVLDVVENSIRANASEVRITVIEDTARDLLTLEIVDNGEGMGKENVKKALDSFYTTKGGKRVGLGLPLLMQAARESGGDMEIESIIGKGTRVKATFQYHHIDRKPLGNMQETLATLIAGNPKVNFVYEHKKG